jgi:hypothetical protein
MPYPVAIGFGPPSIRAGATIPCGNAATPSTAMLPLRLHDDFRMPEGDLDERG